METENTFEVFSISKTQFPWHFRKYIHMVAPVFCVLSFFFFSPLFFFLSLLFSFVLFCFVFFFFHLNSFFFFSFLFTWLLFFPFHPKMQHDLHASEQISTFNLTLIPSNSYQVRPTSIQSTSTFNLTSKSIIPLRKSKIQNPYKSLRIERKRKWRCARGTTEIGGALGDGGGDRRAGWWCARCTVALGDSGDRRHKSLIC